MDALSSSSSLRKKQVLAAILMCEAIRASRVISVLLRDFGAPASANLGQHMLHTAIESFTDSSPIDLSRARGRFQGATAISTQNDSVNQFVPMRE